MFKNLKEMVIKIGIIILPLELVCKYGLSTGTINMNLIEWLDEQQSNTSLKFAKIEEEKYQSKLFYKNESFYCSVLNEQTSKCFFSI